MPELPEVETVRRTLHQALLESSVVALQVLWEGSLAGLTVTDLHDHLVGGQFVDTIRRGKYLGLRIDGSGYLGAHLRMTGRLVVCLAEKSREKHLRVVMVLDDGRELRFVDQRKFGKLFWADDEDAFEAIAHVGVEPLSAEFTPDALESIFAGRKMQIKAALLDQQRIAGLGNIYCDESLFRAGIHPQRPAGSLTKSEIAVLWQAIQTSLRNALKNGGTSFSDYVDGQGRQGENQHYLLVYGKAGEPCPRCGEMLQRIKVIGRGTTLCRRCQR